MIETIVIFGGVLFVGALILAGSKKSHDDGRALGRAEEYIRRHNAIKDMANSQARLADALATKNARLDRIIAKGRESKSGTAQHLAKIAAGEA
jgi:hypothetical protein